MKSFRRVLASAFATVGCIAFEAAEAKMEFGSKEQLRPISPVKLTSPHGQPLVLYRKLTNYYFVIPVWQSDDGFVLVTTQQAYVPLPNADEVAKHQSDGLLPAPLPPWRRTSTDWFQGFLAVWILILVVFGFLAAWLNLRHGNKVGGSHRTDRPDPVRDLITGRLRNGERRETVRADLVSRGAPAGLIDHALNGITGEWRLGSASWVIQIVGAIIAILGAWVFIDPLGFARNVGVPPAALVNQPGVGAALALFGVALLLVARTSAFMVHRTQVSHAHLRYCANCGEHLLRGCAFDGKYFCDSICRNNFRYPAAMCASCIAGTTDEGPGELKKANGTGNWLLEKESECPICFSVVQQKCYMVLGYFSTNHGDRYRIKWRTRKEYIARKLPGGAVALGVAGSGNTKSRPMTTLRKR